ncbi:uncharacterized protein DFL_000127 [Arthrobotrys flagrans]|uniref:F-box domain-containing protein n=1 Tax=Arthrobotrys flagrans TaxID=97331 RepID=A0A437AD86_ARTFL|nr:hypothetical protein DFL_000127 [Arthrobotrys flagrans]
MGSQKDLGDNSSSDEYIEEARADLVSLDDEERLGYANKDTFPADYDEMSTVIELLLRRRESTVPWQSIPEIPTKNNDVDLSKTPLLFLPVDILLVIYDHLSTYDAICLALTSTTFYNLATRRLSGVICPRHLGSWAGKRLAWIDDTMKYRSTFRKYPSVSESLKKSQRTMTSSVPKKGGYIGIPKSSIDTPFKLIEKFPNRLPWNSKLEYDPVAADEKQTAGLLKQDARQYRTRTLGPEFRRMQSLWYQWQSGQLYLPLPIRRFVEGFIGRDTGLSFLTDDSYVLRNLDKGVFVQLDGRDSRNMVRKMIFGPDGSKRGKLSPGYNKWCGDRFDIVKTDTMFREEGRPVEDNNSDCEEIGTGQRKCVGYAPSHQDENGAVVRLLLGSGFL